jgi:hypothetical protein
MSIDEVRARIAELSAEVDRTVTEFDRFVEASPEFRKALGFSQPPGGATHHLLAQARVELAVYTGAMKSVTALIQSAMESGDDGLARQGITVMNDMEDSLALAKATVAELQREDTDGP